MPSGPATAVSIASARRVGVELQPSAEEVVGVDPAEHDGSVGDGGARAAEPVAGRPRVGPRAARADAEQSPGVDPDDRAAAGADRLHVHGADARDVADPAPAEPGLRRVVDLAARDEADVERRAAGVADDQLVRLVASSSRAYVTAATGAIDGPEPTE